MWDIEYYSTKKGEDVVKDFIKSLPEKHQLKALWEVDLLEEYGTALTLPYVKHIESGLWELRIKFASDISRVFYFYPMPQKIILLHGFVKKTDKTPKREIEIAKKRMADYLERINQQ